MRPAATIIRAARNGIEEIVLLCMDAYGAQISPSGVSFGTEMRVPWIQQAVVSNGLCDDHKPRC